MYNKVNVLALALFVVLMSNRGFAAGDGFRMGFVDLEAHKLNPALIHKVPLAMAQAYSLLPLELREGLLLVAVSNPRTSIPAEELKKLTGAEEVQTVLCLPDQIEEMIREKY